MTGIGTIRSAALFAALVLASSCDGAPTPPGDTLQLSTQQVAVIRARMAQIALLEGQLAWLSDSANLVMSTGAKVHQRAIVVDGAAATYYVVGLHREVVAPDATSSFATFHLFAFDDLDDPRKFVVANAYANADGSSPPTSVASSFGGSSVFAHIVEVNGVVTSWPASTGTASFSAASAGVSCSGVSLPPSTLCHHSTIETRFSVTAAGPPTQPLTGTTSRSAAIAQTLIPSITIHTGPPHQHAR